MNRFFVSDVESDALITIATQKYGLKIGELINQSIKNEFLPVTEPFRTEADFILQRYAAGNLDAWHIKQSMSRGIRALGNHPAYDSERLRGFFTRYNLHELGEKCIFQADDILWDSISNVYVLLGSPLSSDTDRISGAYLIDRIFANWGTLWSEKAVYDVLATVAFRYEPSHPFDWYEGILFLSGIEHDALKQWSHCLSRTK